MKRVEVQTYTATIFVAGEYWPAEEACRKFCDEVGLCVTIDATRYVYTGGAENGVRIGLINYGRFPATPDEIFAKAEALANRLLDWLEIESASIVATDRTIWLSKRPDDGAANTQALASGKAEVAASVDQPFREDHSSLSPRPLARSE